MSLLGFVEYPFLHPGPKSGISPAVAGTLVFDPSVIPQVMDGLVPHLGRLRLMATGTIVQAAGAPAIQVDDWDLLLAQSNGIGNGFGEGTGVNFSANGEQPVQCSYLTARMIQRAMQESGGIRGTYRATGPLVPANGTADPVPTVVTLVYEVSFITDRFTMLDSFIRPIQWWSTGTWNFTFSDPVTTLHAGISWQATPTYRLTCDLLMSPHIIWGASYEWRERINNVKTTANTQLVPGVYQVGGFCSPAPRGLGGFACDNLITKLAALYTPDSPLRFPNNLTGLDLALRQVSRGAGAPSSPFGNYLGAPTASTVAAIILFGPRLEGMPVEDIHWPEYRSSTNQLNMTATLNSALTNQHQYWFSRSVARASCSEQSLAGPMGENVKKQIIDAAAGACAGGFGNFVPVIAPGASPPPPSRMNRMALIAPRITAADEGNYYRRVLSAGLLDTIG